jgi:hypothetical protein
MNHTDLSPGEPDDREVRIQQIAGFWRDLFDGSDPGGASWEELDRIHHEVGDCFARQPHDIDRAESLTAYAMLIIANCELF